jgi:dTDP-4-amino-4,6-dideoxygalactose transaminase
VSGSIPVADPGWVFAQHREEVLAAVARVLDSGWYILGEEVAAFEREFATWVGAEHAVGVSSGTDAVAIALAAAGVGAGDAVFTVSHTAVATVSAIVSTGATPVLVDIDPASYAMAPASLDEAVEALGRSRPDLRPAAVVLVHLYGRIGDVGAIAATCEQHGMLLVEDCAQAHGARHAAGAAGTLGRSAAFSFYPTKNLGAAGDAGVVVTADAEVAAEAGRQRQYGWRERYVSETVGRNARLDELQAAVLRTLLPHLLGWNEHRRRVAAAYDDLLGDAGVATPVPAPPGEVHAYHQYVVESTGRDALASTLREAGIGSAVLYPQAVHQQPAYRALAVVDVDLGATERAVRRILALPIGPHVTLDDAARVAEVVRGAARATA